MIRFIDVTNDYWTDLVPEGEQQAAFISTSDDRFVENRDGQHIFHSMEEIDEHPQADRLRALVPAGFFDREPVVKLLLTQQHVLDIFQGLECIKDELCCSREERASVDVTIQALRTQVPE